MSRREDRGYPFNNPANVRRLLQVLYAVLAVLLLLELVVHMHPHYAWEKWFGFYAVFGFAVCSGLVFVAKLLRKFVMRREDYYE